MDWQVVLSVLVALAIWRLAAIVVSVLARRSRLLTRLVALNQVKEAEYRARIRGEMLSSEPSNAQRWMIH